MANQATLSQPFDNVALFVYKHGFHERKNFISFQISMKTIDSTASFLTSADISIASSMLQRRR